MIRRATFSNCETYRTALTREHDPACTRKCCAGFFPSKRGLVSWVLNNPSTADASIDDPTVMRAWDYTKRWGYGAMIFVNTNPYRATNPSMARIPPEEVLVVNDQWLQHAMQVSSLTVCGWGDKAFPMLAMRAYGMLHITGPVHALRVTKSGNPQHPLYLPAMLQPEIWNAERYQQ